MSRCYAQAMRDAIYFVQEPKTGFVKVGWTGSGVRKRVATMQSNCPTVLALLGCVRGTLDDELRLHRKFKKAHVRGEWFDPKRCSKLRAFLRTLTPVDALESRRRRKWKRKRLTTPYESKPGDLGFAQLSPTQREALGRRGGEKAWDRGLAHRYTTEEASAAARKRWKKWRAERRRA